MKIESFKIFSIREKIILLSGILFRKLFHKNLNIYPLLTEKAHFDYLISKGYKLSKITSRKYAVKFLDSNLGQLEIELRRKSSDYKVFDQIIVNKCYQPVIEIFTRYYTAANTILDIGGNIGMASIFFYKCFPTAKLISLEPDVENFKLLKSNSIKNKVNARLIQKALWIEKTTLSLNNSFRDGQSWSLNVSTDINANSILVNSITLDDVLSILDNNVIDILKIDIEGAEFALFKSQSFNTIIKSQVRLIAIEIHEELGNIDYIIQFLTDNNFKLELFGETWIGIKEPSFFMN
jgi:FkbM family methyltransferase